MNDVTLLLNTCDKHAEAWNPFFTLLKRLWDGFDLPIVLNTETKQYEFEGFDITTINFPNAKTWSKRLKNVLNKIETEFVVVFLEDFFLETPVDVAEFERCLSFMRNEPKAGCVSFHNTPDGLVECKELEHYALLERKSRYSVNCQVGLWRTKALKSILRSHENAWEFEKWGSWRSRFANFDIYSVLKGEKIPFDYNWGKPIYRGHWNLQSLKRLDDKLGFVVKAETLPVIENMDALPKSVPKTSVLDKFLRIRSLF